jgi:endoglucanase
MKRSELVGLARRFLAIPTAPYHEHEVRAAVEAECRALGLAPQRDGAGNVLVKRGRGRGAPLVLVAHMDHPGFAVVGPRRLEFFGNVPPEMFVGSRVRVGTTRARITRVVSERPAVREVEVDRPVRGEFGMWDLPPVAVRAGRLHAPGIDDVLGTVVLVATLREAGGPVWCVFTRAEEVGFHGAIELARAAVIPDGALVVSVEMSRQRSWARIGQGPVVRVGDRRWIFDSAAVSFLMESARAAGVTAQRALMDGGTCEATAFAAWGYRVGGVCLPLGHYHNIGPASRPRAEYVSVADLEGLVKLLASATTQWAERRQGRSDLKRWVLGVRRAAPRRLKET